MPVNVSSQTRVQVLVGPHPQSPQGEQTMKNQKQEKLRSAEQVGGRDGNAFAVHLDRALPLLQVEPRPE